MKYVISQVGISDSCNVVDTETNIETVMDIDEIVHRIVDLHEEFPNVIVSTDLLSSSNTAWKTSGVFMQHKDYSFDPFSPAGMKPFFVFIPYQDRRYACAKQVKMQLLKGIAVTIWQDRITNIHIDNDKLVSGKVTLRLSDYGKKLSGCFVQLGNYDIPLELVLDNNIDYRSVAGAFGDAHTPMDYKIDISEVTDRRLVGAIYLQFLLRVSRFERPEDLSLCIIDKPKRIAKYNRLYQSNRKWFSLFPKNWLFCLPNIFVLYFLFIRVLWRTKLVCYT